MTDPTAAHADEQARTFDDLSFEPHHAGLGGVAARAYFPNGYGVSVIKFRGSYGYEDGLYELAVLAKGAGDDWAITYDTPITDDVEGHLSPERVTKLMQDVAALPEQAA